MLCIEHAVETGDANPAMRLVGAVQPRLQRPLVLWFETYSRINVSKTSKGLSCNLSRKVERVDNLDGARANPWHETEAAQKDDLPITAEDLDDSVIRLVDRMQKKLDDGKVLEADTNAFTAKLAAIKALAA